MQFPDHPFWDFSLATYGKEGVADACIALQEAHGADVNVLLFCAWAGCHGVRLDRAQIEAACGAVRGWHEEVVRPLRSVRRRLKSALDGSPPSELQSGPARPDPEDRDRRRAYRTAAAGRPRRHPRFRWIRRFRQLRQFRRGAAGQRGGARQYGSVSLGSRIGSRRRDRCRPGRHRGRGLPQRHRPVTERPNRWIAAAASVKFCCRCHTDVTWISHGGAHVRRSPDRSIESPSSFP